MQPDIRTAARTTARNWEGVIEAEDAEQDIWVHILDAGRHTVDTLIGMDRGARVGSLTMIGRQIASGQRDDYEVYSGNYAYGTGQVRDMLDNGALISLHGDFDVDVPVWELGESIIGQLQRTDTETATERIDLAMGIKALSRSESHAYATLFSRFVMGGSYSSDTERKRVQRAVEALTREMNRGNLRRQMDYDDGPGSRKAVSNVDALRLTRRQ